MRDRLINLLGALQWNGHVGHTGAVQMAIDGDGSERIDIEGLPEDRLEIARQMAQAESDYSGECIEVREDSATAILTRPQADGTTNYTRTVVWPQDKKE